MEFIVTSRIDTYDTYGAFVLPLDAFYVYINYIMVADSYQELTSIIDILFCIFNSIRSFVDVNWTNNVKLFSFVRLVEDIIGHSSEVYVC